MGQSGQSGVGRLAAQRHGVDVSCWSWSSILRHGCDWWPGGREIFLSALWPDGRRETESPTHCPPGLDENRRACL